MGCKHLKENNMTYWQHFRRAVWIGSKMVIGGVLCFIHALFPFLFCKSASKRIKEVHEEIK